MNETATGKPCHCPFCEKMQAQIARLRESGIRYKELVEHYARQREVFELAAPTRAFDAALSDTADNDKWLAERDAKMLDGVIKCLNKISEFCPADPVIDVLDDSENNKICLHNAEIGDTARYALAIIRNQAKKG